MNKIGTYKIMTILEKEKTESYTTTHDALNIISPRISRQRLGAILKTGRLNFIKEESGKILISVRSLLKENKRRSLQSQKRLNVNKVVK